MVFSDQPPFGFVNTAKRLNSTRNLPSSLASFQSGSKRPALFLIIKGSPQDAAAMCVDGGKLVETVKLSAFTVVREKQVPLFLNISISSLSGN